VFHLCDVIVLPENLLRGQERFVAESSKNGRPSRLQNWMGTTNGFRFVD
jgi:hypothetical protein